MIQNWDTPDRQTSVKSGAESIFLRIIVFKKNKKDLKFIIDLNKFNKFDKFNRIIIKKNQ